MSKKIKTCALGNSGVGKSSIILRIVENTYMYNVPATSALDYKSQIKKLNNETVQVELWDTTGQERYRAVMSNFINGADGVFLVFDVTEEKTLDDLNYWVEKLNYKVPMEAPRILLGNKCDLLDDISPQLQEKINNFCYKNKMQFYEVSAKKGTNVKKAYDFLLESAYAYVLKYKKPSTSSVLSSHSAIVPKKKCC